MSFDGRETKSGSCHTVSLVCVISISSLKCDFLTDDIGSLHMQSWELLIRGPQDTSSLCIRGLSCDLCWFVNLYWVFETGPHIANLASNTSCSQGWPWVSHTPASTSWVPNPVSDLATAQPLCIWCFSTARLLPACGAELCDIAKCFSCHFALRGKESYWLPHGQTRRAICKGWGLWRAEAASARWRSWWIGVDQTRTVV